MSLILDPEGNTLPVAPPPANFNPKDSNALKAFVTPDSLIGQPLQAIDPVPDRPAPAGSGFVARYQAFQLYVAGERQADIARVLGVTRSLITKWKREDAWDEKLEDLRTEASRAATFIQGNVLAVTAAKLRTKLETRIHELELLCAANVPPAVRLGAIKLWVELATKLTDQAEKERQVADNPEAAEAARRELTVTGLESLNDKEAP